MGICNAMTTVPNFIHNPKNNKMKVYTMIILLFLSMAAFSQTKQDTTWKARLNNVENSLLDIKNKNYDYEITNIKDKLDFQQKLNEQTISSISTQLDSASYSLTIFGILFAIAAIALGLYVTYIERKIVRIGEENKALLAKNQRIKDDVEALNKLIQNDIYGLFLKIKREESVHTIDRLVKVPKDITNVCDTLLSRELLHEDFVKLKQAYLNLPNKKEGDYGHYYLTVFFQHFLGQSLRDENLRVDIAEFIHLGISASFENDIIKSTLDFTGVLVDKGIQEFKSEMNLFFKGLTNSQYKNYLPVFEVIFENLKLRKNRFEMFNSIDSITENRLAKIEFGNLLANKYSLDNPTESEQLAFAELKELITAQEKADEEPIQKAEKEKKKNEERQKQLEERKREGQQRKLAKQKKISNDDKSS